MTTAEHRKYMRIYAKGYAAGRARERKQTQTTEGGGTMLDKILHFIRTGLSL